MYKVSSCWKNQEGPFCTGYRSFKLVHNLCTSHMSASRLKSHVFPLLSGQCKDIEVRKTDCCERLQKQVGASLHWNPEGTKKQLRRDYKPLALGPILDAEIIQKIKRGLSGFWNCKGQSLHVLHVLHVHSTRFPNQLFYTAIRSFQTN